MAVMVLRGAFWGRQILLLLPREGAWVACSCLNDSVHLRHPAELAFGGPDWVSRNGPGLQTFEVEGVAEDPSGTT